MTEKFRKMNKVEQTIVLFFIWREMNGEKKWYEGGCKELARQIKRSEKSVRDALKLLIERKMVKIQKNSKKLWIKLTLSDEELNTRMIFSSEMFCLLESKQDLKIDLERENKRLDEEIKNYKEKSIEVQIEKQQIETILQKITSEDLRKLANRILVERTWVNVNKSLEEIIEIELLLFRDEMFCKYGEQEDEILQNIGTDNFDFFEEF